MKEIADLARQVIREFDLPCPVPPEALLHVCACKGLRVLVTPRLRQPGYYVRCRLPRAIVRWDAPVEVLCHELAHHLTCDEEEGLAILAYEAREAAAEAFARFLCDPDHRALLDR